MGSASFLMAAWVAGATEACAMGREWPRERLLEVLSAAAGAAA